MTPTDSKSELLKLDTLGRARTSRAKRDEILDAFEASGMSGASFARNHGIRYTTFANWVQQRRKTRKPIAPSTNFTEVTIQPNGTHSTRLTIALPGGASTEIRTSEEVTLAAALLNQIATGDRKC